MPFEALGLDINDWIKFRFDLLDKNGCQVDTVMWDIGLSEDSFATWSGSELLPPVNYAGYNKWFAAGTDPVKALVDESHKRGIEAIWNHRVCPVDLPVPYTMGCPYDSPLRNNYLKKQHPQWVNRCWWPQGLWNLAVKGLRDHKQKYFRELMSRYELDGLELDFARHTPCLPPDREWENREHATNFIRETRALLDKLERKGKRTITLSARIAETVEGCHADGFEVEKWIEEDLIDFLVLGGRTSSVNVDEFKNLIGSKDIKIYPSFDGHHTNDGYYFPPLDYFRGVFSNFRHQGADGISVFNWTCARSELYDQLQLPQMMKCPQQETVLFECGELASMAGKGRIYAVERRGGYPWAGNYLYRNDDKPLPVALEKGQSLSLPLFIYEKFSGERKASLDAVLFNGDESSKIIVEINGRPLQLSSIDDNWKDGQVYGDGTQANAGAYKAYVIDPAQQLVKLSFALPAEALKAGENAIKVKLLESDREVKLEKLEVIVDSNL